jgi:hypothetical protein
VNDSPFPKTKSDLRRIDLSQKSVSNQILAKFAESIKHDDLFDGISKDLIALVGKEKHSKQDVEKLLRGRKDEDSEPGS